MLGFKRKIGYLLLLVVRTELLEKVFLFCHIRFGARTCNSCQMILLLFEQYAIVFIRGRCPFFLNGQAINNTLGNTECPPLRVCRIRIHRIRKNLHESGSFRLQAKKFRKSWFLQFCNFLLYLWRLIELYYFQYLISKKNKFFVGILKVNEGEKSRIRIRIRNSVLLIRIRIRIKTSLIRFLDPDPVGLASFWLSVEEPEELLLFCLLELEPLFRITTPNMVPDPALDLYFFVVHPGFATLCITVPRLALLWING